MRITRKTVLWAALVAEEKKGGRCLILDMKKVASFTRFFVICTGTSATHLKTLCEALKTRMKEKGLAVLRYEGNGDSGWILLDYGDIVIHLMNEETRRYYNLERLWADADVVYEGKEDL